MAKFDFTDILELLPVVGPVVARAPQFVKIFDSIVDTFDDETDQAELKIALEVAQQRSDDAHDRLQRM